MGIHFGIDCATYLDGGELTRVADSLKAPAFVGRYLPVYSVTAAEIAYLHGRGGALLCIDNEDQSGAGLGGSYQAGHDHGQRAAGRWKALGAPAGVAIFLDVEQSFYVSPDYLAGWADGCAASGYRGGCYINSVAGNGHNASYSAARQRTKEPIPIFASEPQPYALANQVAGIWEPAAPDGHFDDVVVWQYCINYGASDLDLCTDAGLSLMWGGVPPTPPKPKPWRVVAYSALKVAPGHDTTTAIDPQHRPVVLEIGAVIHPTGKEQTIGGETWAEIHLPPPSPVHGWLLKSAIRQDG